MPTPRQGGVAKKSRLRDPDLFRCPRRAAARVRSPVRDGDDIHRVRRVAVAIPDLHRPVLPLDLEGNLSHLVLRLARQDFNRDAGRSPRLVPDLLKEVAGDSRRDGRRRLALDPA